jgi:hypothetical protein
MATVTTALRARQPSLLDPEPPPPGGFRRPSRPTDVPQGAAPTAPPIGAAPTAPTAPPTGAAPTAPTAPPMGAAPTAPTAPPTGAAAAAPAGLLDPAAASQPRRQTLEDRIGGTWDALVTSHTAACPLCGGELTPRYSAGARPVGGRCRSCATELS